MWGKEGEKSRDGLNELRQHVVLAKNWGISS